MTSAATPRPAASGIALMLLSIFLFAAMESQIKAISETYPVLLALWARFFFHAATIAPYYLTRRGRPQMRTKRPVWQIVRGLCWATTTLLFLASLAFLPLAETTALLYLTPMILVALSVPLLGEKVGWRRWAGVVAGFIGMLIIVRPGFGVTSWATLLPIGAALTFALYQIATRKVSGHDGPMTTMFYSGLIALVASIPLLIIAWQPIAVGDWWRFLFVGVIGAVGQLTIIVALGRTQASILAPFTYTHIIWAAVFGVLLFDQWPDHWTAIGAAVITASGLYIWHRERIHARGA
ncbi:MAG: DMT family transporter [Alphaproteobacteria bacterium]